ncbi:MULTISPECIES: hypothetical protein [unclassified Microbacterium]|uniref:hypothetical protein n=1 Tax=unclassified Microbacterium TaxID=2609290 RepID=UPI001604EA35|nr:MULTISPECIES: hypothetical protein [unclassified Microbacterium]QNA93585.1 hypothetical protein G4G29_17085 [Microbacterium sp. Se63.02b]QYM63843.1 hypothetical protein K1X59_17155 [Microbacterium sp. Se5.02b]
MLLIGNGLGYILVGGALSGALEALRARNATAADVLGCPIVDIGGAVTADDMRQAVAWLAEGVASPKNHENEQQNVTDVLYTADEMTSVGW